MGAGRITAEWKLPLLCLDQLNCLSDFHEYALIQVIHPPPLLNVRLYPIGRTLKKDQRKLDK